LEVATIDIFYVYIHTLPETNNLYEFLQIYVSKKWGFTKYERDVYEKLRDEGRLAQDGCNVKYRPEHGPLESWKKVQAELAQVA
jgi:hypothetical protein